MKISYDAKKRARTLIERGLDFEDAAELFVRMHYGDLDERRNYGEPREISVGVVRGEVVVVVWTERGDTRRIISMRKADRDERADYNEFLDRSR
jgi:uncharacterized DUF497 family protein